MEVKLPTAAEMALRTKVAGKSKRPLAETLFTMIYRASYAGNYKKAIWPYAHTQELVDYARSALPGLGYKIDDVGEFGGIVISWN